MPLPQDISPVNSELMDSLCKTDDMDWIPMEADPERGVYESPVDGAGDRRLGRAIPLV